MHPKSPKGSLNRYDGNETVIASVPPQLQSAEFRGSSRDFFLSGDFFEWIYCISLVSSAHILKHWQTPWVKHFKRDLFCFTESSRHWITCVCLKLWLWFIKTFICGIISALKRDSMALAPQNVDKQKERKNKTMETHFTASHKHTHNHANNHCPFRSADINCAFSANRFVLAR